MAKIFKWEEYLEKRTRNGISNFFHPRSSRLLSNNIMPLISIKQTRFIHNYSLYLDTLLSVYHTSSYSWYNRIIKQNKSNICFNLNLVYTVIGTFAYSFVYFFRCFRLTVAGWKKEWNIKKLFNRNLELWFHWTVY